MATRWRNAPCGCTVTFEAWDERGPEGAAVEIDCGRHGKLEPREHLLAVQAFSRAMGALAAKRAD